ncbi:DNA (cytosine-5-)-methyltransferase [Ignavigranum ruoffiae]
MTETVNSTPTKKHTLASFFAGVGGIELGFEETGEFSTVYANEFDKNAQKTYRLNYPDVFLDSRDIRDVHGNDIPNVDIITGGFPCQAFSIAGYRLGFEDERGDLFFELLRIIKDKKPRVIFIENVKNMVNHDHGNTFKVIREALVINGYCISWKVLNGMEYGNVPQNRERIYIVGFRNQADFERFSFPEKLDLTTSLQDIIDFSNKEDEYFYYKKGKQPFYEKLEEGVNSKESVYQWRRQYVRENKSGVVPTLTANMGTGGHNVPIVLTDFGIRKLTPRETFNAQGYPLDYQLPSDMAISHLYKQAGNSVVVPVIKRIASKILEAIQISDGDASIEAKEEDKYAIIQIDIVGKYAGESHVVAYTPTYSEVEDFLNTKVSLDRLFITDDQYLRIINKGLSGNYYMVVEL